MFREMFRFEVRYQLRQPLFWLFFFFLGLLTFVTETSDAVQVGGGIGNVHRNSPFVVVQLLSQMTVIGMLLTTVFVAGSIYRDFELRTADLFFSTRLRKGPYLLGRFAGSTFVAALVYLGPMLGILLGSQMPWLDPERLGPTQLAPFVFSFLVFILPNLLFTGALFFALVALTRSFLFTYIGVVGFLTLWGITSDLLSDLENELVSSLADPFGLAPLSFVTRYWTVAEKNTLVPELGGHLLANRLLWVGAGAVILAVTYALFEPSSEGWTLRRRRRPAIAPVDADVRPRLELAPAVRSFDFASQLTMFRRQVGLEVRTILKSVPFLVMIVFALANVLGGASFVESRYGTKVYPVTHLMLDLIEGAYLFMLVIILTFYAGESIWRERSLKLAEVTDSLPVPSWVPLLGKLVALWSVAIVFGLVGVVATVGLQVWRGYTVFEPGLYLGGLAVMLVQFLLIAALGIALQVFIDNKFIGYLAMILYLLSPILLRALHFDHRLYRFASSPAAPYSDMNGFGHFLIGKAWFWLYWSLFAALLVVAASLFWSRGTGLTARDRWRVAKQRFRGPVRPLVAALIVAFVAVGAFIVYNTNVLNEHVPSNVALDRQADYEKKYQPYESVAQPRIVAVETAIDIFPRERRVEAKATYTMVNKTGEPVAALHLSLPPGVDTELTLAPHREALRDEVVGYRILELETPLAPGDSMELGIVAHVSHPGFPNDDDDTSFVYNGTFFNNRQVFPVLGYDRGRRLLDRNERRKRDLPPEVRFASIDDQAARSNTYLSHDSDWITFAATVSTDPDQVALAPGYLEREWTDGGRRYFRYTMDAPILHFYSFLSARWEVKRDRWNGVAIEVYHHPGHDRNVARMIESVKKSLDYFTTHFTPYQHRQVRIVEFPRYATFAQSFPNTIPFSEGIGFIADLRDPEAIDYVFYVTAHEVAHQWWAHQVIGADVQGCTMLSESLSQYSAFMVMEKEYGREKMRRFLKYELDRYLRGRGGDLLGENPLMLVENQQYIHYNKGSVVFYALRDTIGEEAVNAALARYLREVGFQKPPYTTTRDLMAILREVTPPERQGLLADLFETITLFGNRATEAKASRQADGTWKVELTVEAQKLRADGKGNETETPLDDWIDVGVFAKAEGAESADEVLFLEKKHLTAGSSRFEIVVPSEPYEAGIDPYNKLVDRNSSDNRKKVEIVEAVDVVAAGATAR